MENIPVVAVVLLSSSIVGSVVLFCNEVSVSVMTDADISSSVIRSPDKPYILSPISHQQKEKGQESCSNNRTNQGVFHSYVTNCCKIKRKQ